jgi:hypothetical protein
MIIKNNDMYDMDSLLDSINDINYQLESGSMSKSEGLSLLNKCCAGFLSVKDNNPINDWESQSDNDNPIECEVFNYLDELKESGEMNMFESCQSVQLKFNMSNKDSKVLLAKWMGAY